MFAFAYLAIEVTKEMHQANGELVDSDGRRLSTSPRFDDMPSGITVNKKRMLSTSNSTSNELNKPTPLEIPISLYNKLKENFANGGTNLMLPLPEGYANQTITVEIKGYSAIYDLFYGKWSLYGTDSLWMASCRDDQTMCPIKVRPPAGAKRRRLHDRSMSPGTGKDLTLD